MSRKRIPEGSRHVVLVVFYKDGFCTCQAIFDKVIISRMEPVASEYMEFKGEKNTVYLKKTKNSSYISVRLGKKIAEKWLAGEYMVVEPPLLPDTQQRDWLS